MSRNVLILEDPNLSVVWARAFVALMETPGAEIQPLLVRITGVGNAPPPESPGIRSALDRVLNALGKRATRTVANTIFPATLWMPGQPRDELYLRYARLLPRLKRRTRRPSDTYFERLIAFGYDEGTKVNQLDHIIDTYLCGNHRRSALQAAIFDPRRDHTHQRQRGFPCLQHVLFTPDADDRLNVTAVYAAQYIFDRAYGNYLGLCRLGHFMAHEMGLTLGEVLCLATVAQLGDVTKASLRSLADSLRRELGPA